MTELAINSTVLTRYPEACAEFAEPIGQFFQAVLGPEGIGERISAVMKEALKEMKALESPLFGTERATVGQLFSSDSVPTQILPKGAVEISVKGWRPDAEQHQKWSGRWKAYKEEAYLVGQELQNLLGPEKIKTIKHCVPTLFQDIMAGRPAELLEFVGDPDQVCRWDWCPAVPRSCSNSANDFESAYKERRAMVDALTRLAQEAEECRQNEESPVLQNAATRKVGEFEDGRAKLLKAVTPAHEAASNLEQVLEKMPFVTERVDAFVQADKKIHPSA